MARKIKGGIRHGGRVYLEGDESDLNGQLSSDDYTRLRKSGAISGSWDARKEEAPEEGVTPIASGKKTSAKATPDDTEETGSSASETTPTGEDNEAGDSVTTEATTATELPEDFPGRPYLMDAGHKTVEAVSSLDRDALVAVKGVGEKTAEAILKLRK